MADALPESTRIKEHTMTKAELVEEVTRVTELPRKESEAVVETIFESIIARAAGRRQDRDPRLWQFPHAPAPRPHRPQPQDRRESRSAAEENSLLQTQQGTERLRQQSAPRPPPTARTNLTARRAERSWIICGRRGGTATSPTPPKMKAACFATPSPSTTIPKRSSSFAAPKTSSSSTAILTLADM